MKMKETPHVSVRLAFQCDMEHHMRGFTGDILDENVLAHSALVKC